MNKFDINSDYRTASTVASEPYTFRPLDSNHAYNATDFEITLKSAPFAVDTRHECVYTRSIASLPVCAVPDKLDTTLQEQHTVYKKTKINPVLSVNISSMSLEVSNTPGYMARQVVYEAVNKAYQADDRFKELYGWVFETAVHMHARLHRAFGEQYHSNFQHMIYVHLYGYLREDDITYMHLRF